jgi:DNA-binding helix-hairpin-helix protein with protein kinase domain
VDDWEELRLATGFAALHNHHHHFGEGEPDGLLIQAEGLLVAPELEDGVCALAS